MPGPTPSFVKATHQSLMKNLFFTLIMLLACISENHAQFWAKDNGRFGIGDENAYAKLQVNANSSFLNPGIALLDSSATNASGGILQFRSINYDDNHFNIQAKIGELASGVDSRFDFHFKENLLLSLKGSTIPNRYVLFDSYKGALRAGYVSEESMGDFSTALGYNNTASGTNSTALGGGNQAWGQNATALGGGSIAEGDYSTVIGNENHASGAFSLAVGRLSNAEEIYAVAMGDSTSASGASSVALGHKTHASALSSTATGYQTDASGLYSFSGGYYTQATNTSSTSFGFYSQATGVSATSLGYATLAAGENSIALNSVTKAFGNNALSSGYATKAYGWESSAFGNNTTTRSYVSAVFGAYNDTIATSVPDGWVSTDPLLMVGNGVSNTERNNAFTIYKNGNLLAKNPTTVETDPGVLPAPVSEPGTRMMWLPEKSAFRVGTVTNAVWNSVLIGTWSFASGFNSRADGIASTAMGAGCIAQGNTSTAMGLFSNALADYSTAIGYQAQASGDKSIALGNSTNASGNYATSMGSVSIASGAVATAMGYNNEASGDHATAMGHSTNASGNISLSMGFNTNASGDGSMAMGWSSQAEGWMTAALGRGTHAKAFTSTAIGSYNDEIAGSSKTLWVETDPIFYIGNGEMDSSPSNAMVVYKNGNTDINGYTRLGEAAESAPKIKMKELPLTLTGSTYNSFVSVPHGLTAQKILSVSVMVEWAVGYFAPPEYSASLNLRYNYYVSPTDIVIQNNTPSGDCLICERFTKILVTYKE